MGLTWDEAGGGRRWVDDAGDESAGIAECEVETHHRRSRQLRPKLPPIHAIPIDVAEEAPEPDMSDGGHSSWKAETSNPPATAKNNIAYLVVCDTSHRSTEYA